MLRTTAGGPGPNRAGAGGAQPGYSLLELLVAAQLIVILSTIAVAFATARLDQSRTAGAAWYVSGRLALARMESARRSAYVALRFLDNGGGYTFAGYVDGNRNGVRSRDIAAGIDRQLGLAEPLEERFPGVTFGICEGVTGVEPGDSLEGGNPIRIGGSGLLSFSPDGSATSGTVYVRGRGASQYAVRVLGATGRTRVLRYDFQNRRWTGP
jgi:type II secretory pathway pseudopilin PulG